MHSARMQGEKKKNNGYEQSSGNPEDGTSMRKGKREIEKGVKLESCSYCLETIHRYTDKQLTIFFFSFPFSLSISLYFTIMRKVFTEEAISTAQAMTGLQRLLNRTRETAAVGNARIHVAHNTPSMQKAIRYP